MKIKSFGGSAVHVLGSMTIFLHVGNKTFKALCQVTNTDDCLLMGRTLAKTMGYINYPDIKPPTKTKQNMQTSIKTAQTEMNTVDTEAAPDPQRKQCKQTDPESVSQNSNIIDKETLQLIQETINVISSNMNLEEDMLTKPQKVRANLHNEHNNAKVTVNDKEHSLPTTKEYILKEYADVFAGIGTLPGPAYHIELKEDYNPVRNPPRSVPVGMQEAYKAELEILQREDVIIEVNHYTEWVNSVVPVQKPDRFIRLYIDTRNLNMAIKRNPYYMRTLDDILSQLSKARTISISTYQHHYRNGGHTVPRSNVM